MTDRQRNGFILLLVVGLIAASVVVITQRKTLLGLDLKGGVELVYQGQPTAQTPVVTQDALSRAVDIMRQRVDQLGVAEPQIQTLGGGLISAALPDVQNTARAEKLVGTTARLAFYDWEANALTPNGKTVASQLQTQDQAALQISCGAYPCPTGGAQPGIPGAGSMTLYSAVTLASKQAPEPSSDNARDGPQYYMFGAPGSAACAAAARAQGTTPVAGTHCLLSGPADTQSELLAGLPVGVSASQGQTLVVPRGIVVLQAVPASFAHPPSISEPTAQFFVLKDHVSLFGNDITNPQQSTDQSGAPDVAFGFTSHGAKAFQSVTAQIARRGDLVSGLGQTFNQHFAVALDTQLITVPSIDFKTYPDGIPGDNGADITGGFTISSAQDLATQLRLGALPIKLKLISESQVSATLGKQALHQGLIAGLAGLIVVAIFLLSFYRVLGVIAVGGLIVYGLYFYALIKLIPITLTLPGIAGLILTIGVAADANIVIFERVKEEIRGGRSIRQGIVTGYRKGLTAIIDANVVTIMTAFILFVLATADVKGFAFTLGIGTFVSLFTAVLATQAILMTMGSSRLIASPSALGAGGKRRVWRFDFMGASRYFFSMSGVILLIGALAIGGRGLNLGIDFTSGTRITASLVKSASESQVRSVMSAEGVANPEVQKVSNQALGNNVFQISSKQIQPGKVTVVRDALNSDFGVKSFDSTSVGPTFGRTVANSAVIAIIASLLVISAYVALRFEWKFAVPVLIALMHDLLITSGVYSLTGREVTTATVAALLTILGYSLYDTIIVFDRVRENVPRMPRAAFSQIVNRSMSEVLTRSVATTSCTLMPIIALLLFGGATLKDFAFALLIGVASGAYSSIFIASPVLTHWKEREPQYRARRRRIDGELGYVPAYAEAGADIEPVTKRPRRVGRLTEPQPETVSAAEFEEMKRDIAEEEREPSRHTSTLTKRMSQTAETDVRPKPARKGTDGARTPADGGDRKPAGGGARTPAGGGGRKPADTGDRKPADGGGRKPADGARMPAEAARKPAADVGPPAQPTPQPEEAMEHVPAPDIPENEGVAPVSKPKRPSKSRPRNRRHGRRR
ncbi:MAG: protein translocase subunit SecD [Solirubrobacterales bacterium]|nr:protein translocase subunit SecD [Solirubrobacterales bacterium]